MQPGDWTRCGNQNSIIILAQTLKIIVKIFLNQMFAQVYIEPVESFSLEVEVGVVVEVSLEAESFFLSLLLWRMFACMQTV